MSYFPRRREAGCTLIELLVVMAIIAVLIALLLPAVQAAREAARRCQCVNNLMQLGVAIQNYESAHEVLPPGVVNQTGPIATLPTGYHMGWIVQILPYIEQKNAYKKTNFKVGVYDAANVTVSQHLMSSLLCPSDGWGGYVPGAVAGTNYAACHHDVEAPIDVNNKGLFFLNSHVRYEDITDGTSFTILVGEYKGANGGLGWMSGTRTTLRNTGSGINSSATFGATAAPVEDEDEAPARPALQGTASAASLFVGGFSSSHPGGANFAFSDGSVRFLKNTIGASVFHCLGNREDGELVNASSY